MPVRTTTMEVSFQSMGRQACIRAERTTWPATARCILFATQSARRFTSASARVQAERQSEMLIKTRFYACCLVLCLLLTGCGANPTDTAISQLQSSDAEVRRTAARMLDEQTA